MSKKLFIWIGSLLFGVATLSYPAQAGYKATVLNSPQLDAQALVGICLGYEFNTLENLKKCFYDSVPAGFVIQSATTYGFAGHVKLDGVCRQHASSAVVDGETTGLNKFITGPFNSNQYFFDVGVQYKTKPTATYPNQLMFSESSCTTKAVGTGRLLSFTIAQTSGAGDDGPTEHVAEDDCALNHEWAASEFPPRDVSLDHIFTPSVGKGFGRTYYNSSPQPAGKGADGKYVAGSVFKVSPVAGKSCTMWRKARVDLGRNTFYYIIEYLGKPEPGATLGDGAGQSAGNRIEGSSKLSKPIVPYGTPFNGQTKAQVISTVDRVIAERERELQTILTAARALPPAEKALPIAVEVPRAPPVDGRTVDFHHPAPQQLARDAPQPCIETFVPRCAWNPSPTTPATPETPKDQLVRMTADGHGPLPCSGARHLR